MPLLDKHIINQCLTLGMEDKMTLGETVINLKGIGALNAMMPGWSAPDAPIQM